MKNGQNFQFQGVFVCLVNDLYFNFQHFLCTNIILVLIFSNYHTNCVTQLMLYTGDKLSSTIFCLWVCQASVTPDQISTFSNIYRHTSPLLTMYHLISSSTNLYWPSTSQYRHILTQYHQVPLIIHHLMSHAQYTWSSSLFRCASISWIHNMAWLTEIHLFQ